MSRVDEKEKKNGQNSIRGRQTLEIGGHALKISERKPIWLPIKTRVDKENSNFGLDGYNS